MTQVLSRPGIAEYIGARIGFTLSLAILFLDGSRI